jgi:phosphoserine phosphatase RsbU/P
VPNSNTDSVEPVKEGWDLSFRTKLLIGVCGVVLLTGAVITALADRNTKASTEALVQSLFREVNGHAVTHTRAFVSQAVPLAESMQNLADNGLALDDSDRLAQQLLAFLEANPGMSWISYGDESGGFTGVQRTPENGLRVNQSRIVDGHTRLIEHNVQPDGSWKLFRQDDDSGYDPRARPYYQSAKKEGKLVWVPPYVFYNQQVPGISCATPVLDGTGKLRGVLSVDFDLNALSEFVDALSLSPNSLVFLFTPDETLLAYPKKQKAIGNTAQGKLLTLADADDGLVQAFRKNLKSTFFKNTDEFHFFEFRHDGAGYLASVTTFPVGNGLTWVVGAIAPQADFLADIWRRQWVALAAAMGALALAVLLAAVLARHISGPVQSLIGFMRRVGDGHLEEQANFGGSREFRQLSTALNRMIADLRDRLRLRHSLDVAMEVQQQLLPNRPPVVQGLDIAGHSTYCDETGGDYYDFLIVDESTNNHVLIALGDVMGHGVAAALVMAGARAVLRDRANSAGSLAELMSRLNRMLASDLEGSRFMTMHLGVMNAVDKTYRWASAGHDPAMIYDPARNSFDEQDQSGMPLGIMEDAEYEEHTCGSLKPGHVLVVGTDGVWEMPNAVGEQYGKQRLRDVIAQSASESAEQIAHAIRDSLATFQGSQRAVDDVTFVVLKVI